MSRKNQNGDVLVHKIPVSKWTATGKWGSFPDCKHWKKVVYGLRCCLAWEWLSLGIQSPEGLSVPFIHSTGYPNHVTNVPFSPAFLGDINKWQGFFLLFSWTKLSGRLWLVLSRVVRITHSCVCYFQSVYPGPLKTPDLALSTFICISVISSQHPSHHCSSDARGSPWRLLTGAMFMPFSQDSSLF